MQPLTIGAIVANREVAAEIQACLKELPVRMLFEQPEIGQWSVLADKLDRLRPDVLLLDLGDLWDSLEDAVRGIRRTAAAPVVIGVHTKNDSESILRAMRAGCGEYLCPPLCAGLKAALERISEERGQARGPKHAGKCVAFFSAKGGCGATTVMCHTALEVQRLTGDQLLLADFDFESGMLGFLMKSKSAYSVSDAMCNVHRLDPSMWKALVSNGTPGVELITAPPPVMERRPDEHERLRQVLRFASANYGWVFVDLGRGLSKNCLGVLEEVDETYLVTTIEVPSLYRSKQILETLRNAGYRQERLRVVLNRVPRSVDVTRDEVQQMLGVPLAASLPESYDEVYEAYADRKLLPPAGNLGKRFAALASRIAGVPRETAKKRFGIFG
jgi:pilus assembly protein CpaE